MTREDRLSWSLLLLRLGVFIVMFMWTLRKFIQPEASAGIFENFYGLSGLDTLVLYVLGVLELLLLLAFVSGSWKRISYGLVMILHGVSTFSSYAQYFDPFNNMLFFAAWPMLAACVALYLLRDEDTRLTLGLGEKRPASAST